MSDSTETLTDYSFKGLPSFEKTFRHLDQALQKLTSLTRLNMNFGCISEGPNINNANPSLIFNVLPAMLNLKELFISLPFLKESIKKHPGQAKILLRLKSVANPQVRDSHVGDIQELDDVLERMDWQQNLLRCFSF